MITKTETGQTVRSVKTLLLCKVEIGHESNIKELYTGNAPHTDEDTIEQYFALGDFDAFSIYDTCEHPCSKAWLAEVYSDRLQLSKKAGRLYSYNPIHLVSTGKEKQQDDAKNFCAATIIYGWKDETKPIEESISGTIKFLLEEGNYTPETYFSVFQAVNICDAVILWRSDSYKSLCQKTMRLLQGGFARKTYTIIGARYTVKDDIIDFCCLSSQESSNVQIRGSIREIQGARKWLDDLHRANSREDSGGKKPEPHSFHFLSGGFDFVEDYHDLPISTLLRNLMDTNNDINTDQTGRQNAQPSFWDMHTDVITSDPGKPDTDENPPSNKGDGNPQKQTESKATITDALNTLYNRFIDQYHDKLLPDKANSQTEDWPFSYGELLGVTASIDQNPALRTPAYLMFDYLRVCDSVFRRIILERAEGYEQLLSDSLEKLKKAIHSWNQLIDQTIRTDELVIKGIGFASSIYNSVPVQLVDFYNSFINNFVASLLEFSGQEVPDYAFLLLLNQSYQIRISSLFSDEELRRKMVAKYCIEGDSPKDCKKCGNGDKDCWRKKCWPREQVYLVEIPTDALYKPTELIVSLAHEVFHIFGDNFRHREFRWQLFGLAAIKMLLHNLHIEDKTEAYNALRVVLKEKLKIGEDGLTVFSPNLRETEEYFAEKLSQLLEKSPTKAFPIAEGKGWRYYLDSKVFVDAWGTLKNDFYIKKVQQKDVGIVSEFVQFEYFLRECFADICAIRAFKIDLTEYFPALDRGIPSATHPQGLHRVLQRAMLTTAACINSFGLDIESKQRRLNDCGQTMYSAFASWAKRICEEFSKDMENPQSFILIEKRVRNILSVSDDALGQQPDLEKIEKTQEVLELAFAQYNINPDGVDALEQLKKKIENRETPIKPLPCKKAEDKMPLKYFMASYLESIVLQYLKRVNEEWDKYEESAVLIRYQVVFHNLIRNADFFTQDFMNEIKEYHNTIEGIAYDMTHSAN